DGGWAEYVRRREAAQPPVRAQRGPVEGVRGNREVPPARSAPSELERVEAEIAEREAAVAELERELAVDWNDVDLLARHRRAREELRALLQRWETLFERAQG